MVGACLIRTVILTPIGEKAERNGVIPPRGVEMSVVGAQ
jgi:hypothetical protein